MEGGVEVIKSIYLKVHGNTNYSRMVSIVLYCAIAIFRKGFTATALLLTSEIDLLLQ